jgi:hypothetical protein
MDGNLPPYLPAHHQRHPARSEGDLTMNTHHSRRDFPRHRRSPSRSRSRPTRAPSAKPPRARRLLLQRLAHHRHRRHHYDRVAGRRDGSGFVHHAAADPRRELDADWAQVPTCRRLGRKKYGNPTTAGISRPRRARRCMAFALRIAGAQARRALPMRWRRNGTRRSASLRPSRVRASAGA